MAMGNLFTDNKEWTNSVQNECTNTFMKWIDLHLASGCIILLELGIDASWLTVLCATF